MIKVQKRDGSLVDFDAERIITAIEKAYAEKEIEYSDKQKQADREWIDVALVRCDRPENVEFIDIEDIQNQVQKHLIETCYPVGLAFILYREHRRERRVLVDEQIKFVRNYMKSSNTANATIDDNSNVGNKNIGVLNAEIHKVRNIDTNRGWEEIKLKELFPDSNLSKMYYKDLLSRILYKNDENSFPFHSPYCVSATMYPFLLHGLFTIGGKSTQPKHLDSFCNMYVNLVFALSGMFAGAVATPEFLLYLDYFARKEWGDDYYLNPDKSVTADWVERKMTIKTQLAQYLQTSIHSINQPSGARGQQSAFVNFSIYDKAFFDGMFGNFYFPDGTQPKWESLQWLQEMFMEWFNNERLHTMLTFPVVSVTLLKDENGWADERMVNFVCKQWAEGDSFFVYISDSVDSLSSCCRLKNKIQTKEFNFTNGNIGVETGSKSVISLNLSRIMQNFFREVIGDKEPVVKNRISIIKERWAEFQSYLNAILERVYKYHIAYNENLYDFCDAGLLPAYTAGFIDLDKQYLTVGINGLNQSAEFLGMQCRDNTDYQWYCDNLFSTIKEANSAHNGKFNGHKLSFNTECVPAESLAVKNYNWDKSDGYWVPEDTNLYASYIFKPNDPKTQILEKVRLHGNRFIGDFLDGGSAAHLNLDAHLSQSQYEYILNYAADNGCQYLTFNVPNSECDECHFITKRPIEKCPKCGSEHITKYDRIIGYLTAIKNWSDGRQKEQKTRVYEDIKD